MSKLQSKYRPLLETVGLAARAHHGQLRKDHKTPYVSHVFRVMLVVRQIFGFEDPAMLTTALLHDTLEDTTTDFDDLEEIVGADIAHWVALLSKDTRMQDKPREEAYRAALASAPWQVKVCKLADIFDNLMDSTHLSDKQIARTLERSGLYLQSLDDPNLPEPARKAFDLVCELREEIKRRGEG